MKALLISAVLLVGCVRVGEPPDYSHPHKDPTNQQEADEQFARAGGPAPRAAAAVPVPVEAPRPVAPVKSPEDEDIDRLTSCESRRERYERVTREVAQAKAEREAYFRDHCTGSVTQTVRVYHDGSRAGVTYPQPVWMCDGKPVSAPYSAKEANLEYNMIWLRDHQCGR